MRRAHFGIRLAAGVVDVIALYLIYRLVTRYGPGLVRELGVRNFRGERAWGWSLIGTGLLWIAYASAELFGRASPAKWLLGMHVASGDHGPATFAQRARRWVLKHLPLLLYLAAAVIMFRALRLPPPEQTWVHFVLPMLVCGLSALVVVGGLLVSLGHDGKSLHDYLGGTVVLRVGRQPRGFVPIIAEPVAPAGPAATHAPPPETTTL